MPKPRVFISHIRDEKDLAIILKQHLNNLFPNEFDIFVSSDGESIIAGENWLKQLDSALKRAKVELVLCSGSSVKRP